MNTVSNSREKVVTQLAQADDARFGGKAAGLAKLMKLGLRVPNGFCVRGNWQSQQNEVARAYSALASRNVAVRSSASSEDGSRHSAAGQFESVLNVSGEKSLFAALETCFASLSSGRVDAYFQHMHDDSAVSATMTAVVQQMVPAAVSGVLFTVEPQSVVGESSLCVIEACAGAGEQLVSGHAQAARYTVHRESRNVTGPQSGSSIVSDAQLQQLADEALRAEAAFDTTLDLEWALDAQGNLFWLQARPITTLFAVGPHELDAADAGEHSFFTRANIGEMMPGAATPLTINVFGDALNAGFVGLYGASGALPRHRKNCRFVVSFQNHLFIDLVLLSSIVGRVAGTSREALEVSLFGRELPDSPPVEWVSSFRRGVNFVRYLLYVMGYRGAVRKLKRIRDNVHIDSSGSAATQYAAVSAFLPVYQRVTTLHLQSSSYSGALNGALREVLKRGGLSIAEQMESIAQLLLHIDGIESAQIIVSLEEIAAMVKRERPDISLRQEFAAHIVAQQGEGASTAAERFAAFLARHGHRCVREAELSEREWSDDPDEIIENLWNIYRRKDERIRTDSRADQWLHTVSRICKAHPRVNRRALSALTKRARNGVRTREFTKSIMIQMNSRLRRAYRLLAEQMVAEGILSSAETIFFFAHAELGILIQNPSIRIHLHGKAAARQQFYRQHEDCRFDDFCRGIPVSQQAPVHDDNAELWTGLAVSPGKVTASVRVVRDKDDARRLRDGEIMCARFTDVGWTPYYGIISGLITEIGSSLSHGAVVAREYQLPLVSSVEGATSIFKNGDVVELDGLHGTVRMLQRASAS